MQKNWLTSFLSGIWDAFRKSDTTTTTTPIVDLSNTTTTIGDNKVKIALCVGINKYPNPANNLHGCVNDANDLASLLRNTYGFNDVIMLLDSEATYSNVTRAIADELAKSPDVFVYTNSSHGTRVPDTTGTEVDGYCEAICLYDKFLVDHDFHKILAKANPKTHVIVFSDSCHSGNVTREFLMTMNDSSYISVPKYLPHPDNIEAYRAAMSPTVRAIFEAREVMNEVLLAGCQSNQYSYDANFNGRPNGAYTYFALQILKENPAITYNDFVSKLNKYLPSTRYPQNPVCETNSNMRDSLIFG